MSDDVVVRIDTGDFRRWLREAGEQAKENARRELRKGVDAALDYAKSTTSFKDRTGELRRSIIHVHKSEWVHYLKASAKHAAFVEYGTNDSTKGPIVAGGCALRFVFHGTLMFRKSVKHKGMKARNFMQAAADVGEKYFDYYMEDAIARAFR